MFMYRFRGSVPGGISDLEMKFCSKDSKSILEGILHEASGIRGAASLDTRPAPARPPADAAAATGGFGTATAAAAAAEAAALTQPSAPVELARDEFHFQGRYNWENAVNLGEALEARRTQLLGVMSNSPTDTDKAEWLALLNARRVLAEIDPDAGIVRAQVLTSREANCILCFDTSIQTVSCSRGHAICVDCLMGYFRSRLEQHQLALVCPDERCTCSLSMEWVEPHLTDQERHKYVCIRTRQTRDHMRQCPRCRTLQAGNPTEPAMTCTACKLQYCFYHETAHAGRTCSIQESWTSRTASAWWNWVHTKDCPECRAPMQKNGGCPHMTCRCGHQFCWDCMRPWFGHNYDLFPAPSELSRSCQSKAMWAKRVGVVAAAPVISALAVAAVVPYSLFVIVAYPFTRKSFFDYM
eukprot:m.884245 g.884245  ORF g.884245 m.884245 type:complete len:411 (-) comp59889_c0_seq3:95-1327(-)